MHLLSQTVVRAFWVLPTLCGILLASLPLAAGSCQQPELASRGCCQSGTTRTSASPRCCGCCPSAESAAAQTLSAARCVCRATDPSPANPERPARPLAPLRIVLLADLEGRGFRRGQIEADGVIRRCGDLPPPGACPGDLLVKNCVWRI